MFLPKVLNVDYLKNVRFYSTPLAGFHRLEKHKETIRR